MQVVILCGGRGTRAYPYTDFFPKPMVPVGGTPMLVHVMRLFAEQGHQEFILSVGYRKDVILDYFDRKTFGWDVQCVDTGESTDTGGRIERCKHLLGEQFLATYSDGLSDIVLSDLIAFHRDRGSLATMTSVPLVSQYGTLSADEQGRVTSFQEKPVLAEHSINAGFFVFDRRVFDHWNGSSLERDVLPGLARRNLLYTYRHAGYFKSLDSHKDHQEIEMMLQDGRAFWTPAQSAIA